MLRSTLQICNSEIELTKLLQHENHEQGKGKGNDVKITWFQEKKIVLTLCPRYKRQNHKQILHFYSLL